MDCGCCMALSTLGLYCLNVDHLRLECSERGPSCSGPVRVLRHRLAEYLRCGPMERNVDQENTQASFPAGTSNTRVGPVPPFR